MSSYFKLRSYLSRGVDDATAKKKACAHKDEYFYRDATGRLAQVSVYEDGFVYRSAATFRQKLNPDWPGKPGEKTPPKYVEIEGEQLGVPVGAVACSAAEYEAALEVVLAYEKKKAEELAKETEFSKSLKKGMSRAQHAAEEADVAEPVAVPFAELPALSAEVVADLHAHYYLYDFTVLDIEFQGTDMLELAAIRYQDWQPIGQLQTFVRFRGELNYHVANLTGISNADVWNAPEEKAVLQQFKKLAGNSLLVCHNLSADRRILEAARTRLGAPAPLSNEWFCTLALSKQRLPNRKHGLGELCADFGIATHGAHRALRDVEMCFGLLRHLHQLEPITGPLVVKPKGKKAALAQPSLFAAA
ncbi:3'-5' exonuclease [Hymenobacter fodinae]|uniref:3'-5' exonuclease n=1 Tax=Hymenobacter fodinae TaxID=2510796 RepID=A0A4Z0P5R1_9BACT|nr:3'-5' exonuclease [Hymenobacter fodinae]TGE07732.1 3'-5' exonuclease [Hymenobacter fodinae]